MNHNQTPLPNIDTLIAPIEGSHQGVGEDLTFDYRLDSIVAARQEDDASLAQGNWVTELKVADWGFVKAECEDILITTSKDLKIALWYTDALSHTHHLAGINYGLNLLIALNDDYWLTMYPPLDGEDDSMDIRAGLLSWFVKALSDDLKQLPLADSQRGSHTYNDFLTAREHDKQRQQNPDSDVRGTLTVSDYHQAIKLSDSSWQQTLITELATTQQHWQTLTEQLNDLMGMDAPVFASVTELLDTLTQHLESLIPQQPDELTGTNQTTEPEYPAQHSSIVAATHPSGSVSAGFNPQARDHQANRQQALKLIAQIQDYFAVNEPHSPVTFLLARAIEWADMPLDQWLARVIKNEDQLATLSDMIGIKTPTASDDSSY